MFFNRPRAIPTPNTSAAQAQVDPHVFVLRFGAFLVVVGERIAIRCLPGNTILADRNNLN